jgi:hypothetical protein
MLDTLLANYLLVAVVVLIIWFVALGVYLYSSSQHTALEDELNRLNQMLDEEQRPQ